LVAVLDRAVSDRSLKQAEVGHLLPSLLTGVQDLGADGDAGFAVVEPQGVADGGGDDVVSIVQEQVQPDMEYSEY